MQEGKNIYLRGFFSLRIATQHLGPVLFFPTEKRASCTLFSLRSNLRNFKPLEHENDSDRYSSFVKDHKETSNVTMERIDVVLSYDDHYNPHSFSAVVLNAIYC